jgi:hypothetical protein
MRSTFCIGVTTFSRTTLLTEKGCAATPPIVETIMTAEAIESESKCFMIIFPQPILKKSYG